MLEKEKTNKMFSPCLFYTGAILLSFIFSTLFLKTAKTPTYIINDVVFSIDELNKKIERKTMAGVGGYSSSDITDVEQIKKELISIRDRAVGVRMRIIGKTWAN